MINHTRFVVVILFLYASESMAVSPYVAGSLGYAGVALTDTMGSEDMAVMVSGSARAGVDLFKYFGIEGQLGRGLNKGEVNFPNGRFDISFTRFASIYGKLIIPLRSDISLYGFGGYSTVSYKAENDFDSDVDSEKGVSYGLGALFRVNPRFSLVVDALSPHKSTVIFSAGVRVDLQTSAAPAK